MTHRIGVILGALLRKRAAAHTRSGGDLPNPPIFTLDNKKPQWLERLAFTRDQSSWQFCTSFLRQ